MVEKVFAPDGLLVQQGREHRPGQLALARAVARCFTQKLDGMLEGACGVGKSYAYLVCAVIAASLGVRISISVGTNALIEQIRKDLPAVMKLLGINVRFAVIKGRKNYLCNHRAHAAMDTQRGSSRSRAKLSPYEDQQLDDLLVWSNDPKNIDLTTYHSTPKPRVHRLVTITGDDCKDLRKRGKCKYDEQRDESGEIVQRLRCNFLLARREAQNAMIVITNFDVLLWNYETGCGMLGHFDLNILDEAHGFPGVVRDHFSTSFTLRSLSALAADIREFTTSSNFTLPASLPGIEPVRPSIKLRDAGEILAKKIERTVVALDAELRAFAIPPPRCTDKEFEKLLDPVGASRDRFTNYAKSLLDACESIVRAVTAAKFEPADVAKLNKTGIAKRFLAALAGESNFAIAVKLEKSGGGDDDDRVNAGTLLADPANPPRLSITVTPVSLGGYMRATIHASTIRDNAIKAAGSDPGLVAEAIVRYSNSEHADTTTIALSATLSPDGTWDHPKAEFGMPMDTVTAQVASPFDFERNAIWYLPANMPESGGESRKEYNIVAGRQARQIVEMVGGRTLILCSRRDDMEVAAKAIRGLGFDVLVQGEAPPKELTRRFKEDPNSCLIGSKTFGTGFDVPGHALECVIVWKLPFRPQNPVDEILQKRMGKGAWRSSVYVPDMLLDYRQWVGRLVRQQDDIGVVALLDSNKIRTMGKPIRGAMPAGIQSVSSLTDVRSFLAKHRVRAAVDALSQAEVEASTKAYNNIFDRLLAKTTDGNESPRT